MTPGMTGAQSIYDYWLGILPHFFAQLGALAPAALRGNGGNTSSLPFPVDQVAKAATLTQQALNSIAQSYAPMLQAAGAPGLLAQWAAAIPPMMNPQPKEQQSAADLAMAFAPWMTGMPFASLGNAIAATSPAAAATGGVGAVPAATSALLPFQQMQNAWLSLGHRMVGGSPETYATAFDRTYGALSDALGLAPMRKLQSATGHLMAAAAAHNEARAAYAMLVQSAFAAGLDELLRRLAEMAQRGERVDSVLALLRLWASATEQAVHQVLQSERGLDATAALTRAGLGYRKQLQEVAATLADVLDMATRRDLDEAYREIQDLKRELRSVRAAPPAQARSARPHARRTTGKKP
jgi:hypothetical protein